VVGAVGLVVFALVDVVHVEEGNAAGGKVVEDFLVAAGAVPGGHWAGEVICASGVVQGDQERLAGAPGEGAGLVEDPGRRALAVVVEQFRGLLPLVCAQAPVEGKVQQLGEALDLRAVELADPPGLPVAGVSRVDGELHGQVVAQVVQHPLRVDIA